MLPFAVIVWPIPGEQGWLWGSFKTHAGALFCALLLCEERGWLTGVAARNDSGRLGGVRWAA